MKKFTNLTILRMMFLESAFGRSGNLKEDIFSICKRHRVAVSSLDVSKSSTLTGKPGSTVLFGGHPEEKVVTIEAYLPNNLLQELKENVLDIMKEGKDTIAFSTHDLEAYTFNDRDAEKYGLE